MLKNRYEPILKYKSNLNITCFNLQWLVFLLPFYLFKPDPMPWPYKWSEVAFETPKWCGGRFMYAHSCSHCATFALGGALRSFIVLPSDGVHREEGRWFIQSHQSMSWHWVSLGAPSLPDPFSSFIHHMWWVFHTPALQIPVLKRLSDCPGSHSNSCLEISL